MVEEICEAHKREPVFQPSELEHAYVCMCVGG